MHVRYLLKRALGKLGADATVRRLVLRARRRLKRPHEADFRAFALLRDARIFVDGGANTGQSAASFRIYNAAPILSFEANPLLEPELGRIGGIVSDFAFRMVGLSDRAGALTLFVPVVNGQPLTGEATLDRAMLENPNTMRRIAAFTGADNYTTQEVCCRVVALDDLGLDPGYIKLDLQGHEIAALHGMLQTISRSRPVLMLENGPRFDVVRDMLRPLGYAQYVYRNNALTRSDELGALNTFYLA